MGEARNQHGIPERFSKGQRIASTDGTRHYRLLDVPTGRGGMAAVYLAWSERLGKEVAIKVEKFSQPVLNIQREASMLAKSALPNIVEIYDLVTLPDGSTGVVMEYLSTERAVLLRDYLRDKQPLPVEDVDAIATGIGQFIDAYAATNHFHNDLKLENIFFFPKAFDRYIKIIDLGLAMTPQELAAISTAYSQGTPIYMSPERFLGQPTTLQDEVFAMAIILVNLLGKTQYASDIPDPQSVFTLYTSPKDFYQLLRASSRLDMYTDEEVRDIARVLEKGAAPRRAQRYETGRAFAQALRDVLFAPSHRQEQGRIVDEIDEHEEIPKRGGLHWLTRLVRRKPRKQ